MPDAERQGPVRFLVIGVAHPHAIVLTAALRDAGAICTGWVDTPGEHEGLFAAVFPELPPLDLVTALDAAPDLAVIASVPSRRPGHAIQAMDAGADVLVAKPAAIGHGQIAELDAAVAATGRRWWVAFTEHFTSRAVVRADRLVAAGRIGTVRHVLGLGPHRLGADRPAWFSDPSASGAMLADLASHQIHHAARLLGTADLRVVAARTTPATGRSHPDAIGEVLLEGGSGSAYVKVDWLTPDGLDTWGDVRLMITGETGTIEVRSNCDPAGRPGGDHLFVVDAAGVEHIDCSDDGSDWAGVLLDDVRHGTETLLSTDHALAVTRLALRVADLADG